MSESWDGLSEHQQRACRQLVRLAGRRSTLGRRWHPVCINVPAILGMPDELIRQEWATAAQRAERLLQVLSR